MFDGQTLDTRTNEWLHSSLFPKQREEKEGGACPSFIDTRQLQVGKTFSLVNAVRESEHKLQEPRLSLAVLALDHDGIAHAAAIASSVVSRSRGKEQCWPWPRDDKY